MLLTAIVKGGMTFEKGLSMASRHSQCSDQDNLGDH
jgi:hypothetical protein